MSQTLIQRMLRPVAQLRAGEGRTVLLMFGYSFLVMTAYNIVKPITRSKFISDLGADNLPYVQLVAGVLVGVVMLGYAWALSRLPRRWGLPITQAFLALILLAFWVLFQSEQEWVSVAFYFFGLILGILLISQFWTLANVVYDPRQAKRIFGFIGGGAPLGGIAGSAILTGYATTVGTINLLLVSAVVMLICIVIVVLIIVREKPDEPAIADAVPKKKEGVGGRDALRLLRESNHLQIIALVISFAAIGAAIIEQQLNMAAQASKGQEATDAITTFLAQVQLWTSMIGLVVQIWLTSRIHRFLGIGFALMVLPVSLGSTAVVMLLISALWAPALARVLDQTLRYTVDKTTREILFLPLPSDVKYRAKAFVDVTVDRFAKGLGAVLILVLIKPWGFELGWQQLSYASVTMTGLWLFMAIRARRGYLKAFRQSIERRDMQPADLRINAADLSTVETLIEELAAPEEDRVLYAIDILESLDKRNLVSPLLLHHESPRIRARALGALGAARPESAERWAPGVERMLGDDSADVRAAAVAALAAIRHEQAADLVRPHLDDTDPRTAATAAAVLARSHEDDDLARAESTFARLAAESGNAGTDARCQVAAAIRETPHQRFHRLLIPLLYDPSPRVAAEAMRSVAQLGTTDFLFVPTLVSLLRHRQLKKAARSVLVSYGESVLEALAFFLKDADEDLWIRRHLPATIARIPCQRSLDILVENLDTRDGFLRFKLVAAIERVQRKRPDLSLDREPIEALIHKEGLRYFYYLSLQYNLFDRQSLPKDSVLALALQQKIHRTVDRIYRLLGLIFPWKDIAAARWAIEHGDARARAGGTEYLDNILSGLLRKRIMPVLEELPLEEKVNRGNVFLKTRIRDVEESLLQLINDDDAVVSAAAIDLVRAQDFRNLTDDVEHVLAHRDVQDWHVFEAASWTLAAFRVPEEQRRTLWLEPLPAVKLADRLRRMPLFAAQSIDELFRVARVGRQVRHEAGRVLHHEGVVPEAAQFLLDGHISLVTQGGEARDEQPPASFGLHELLEGVPASETVRSVTNTVCLVLTREEFQTLLADNADLVQGLLRTLIGHDDLRDRLVHSGERDEGLSRYADGNLTPIDTVLALKRVPIFSRIETDEMLNLATVAREVPLEAGAELFGPSDVPSVYVILSGEAVLDVNGRTYSVGPGAAIGVFETLAGVSGEGVARVETAGLALRIEHEDLADLLGQHSALLQQIFGALFRSRKASGTETRQEVAALDPGRSEG